MLKNVCILALVALFRTSQGKIIWFEPPCCFCVKSQFCVDGILNNEGVAKFDSAVTTTSSIYNHVNVKTCPKSNEVCCKIPKISEVTCKRESSDSDLVNTRIGGRPSSAPSPDSPPVLGFPEPPLSPPLSPFAPERDSSSGGGSQDKNKNDVKAPVPISFGDYPWQALVLQNVPIGKSIFNLYLSSASLIHPEVVLTSAQSLQGKDKADLVVRVGEWNPTNVDEPHPHQDVEIKEVLIHPNFTVSPLAHDVALLFLKQRVELGPNVDVIPLTQQPRDYDPFNCIALRWEKTAPELTSYKTSLVRKRPCQRKLRKKSTKTFTLDPSFICALGSQPTENCEIDRGSPLICEKRRNPLKFLQVGIASWGVDCKDTSIPNVYSSIIGDHKWISDNINSSGGGGGGNQQNILFPQSVGVASRMRPANDSNGQTDKTTRRRGRKERKQERKEVKKLRKQRKLERKQKKEERKQKKEERKNRKEGRKMKRQQRKLERHQKKNV